MVEILKQAQYQPLAVERQIAIIFAGTQGLLDDLPVDAVREFETFFYDWLDRMDTELLKEIRDEKELSNELRDALTRAVQGAKAEFNAPRVGANPERDSHEDGGEA